MRLCHRKKSKHERLWEHDKKMIELRRNLEKETAEKLKTLYEMLDKEELMK
jgi:hypothetical protein